jgi:hypothetical protein
MDLLTFSNEVSDYIISVPKLGKLLNVNAIFKLILSNSEAEMIFVTNISIIFRQ